MSTIVETPPIPDAPLCREKSDSAGSPGQQAGTAADPETETGRAILCRSCRQVITSRKEEIAVNGRHQHTFFNPAGIVFEIMCFRRADGCAIHGPLTDEFTWFAGHEWQYCLCSACQVHIGWYFSGKGKTFFGLISHKLLFDSKSR